MSPAKRGGKAKSTSKNPQAATPAASVEEKAKSQSTDGKSIRTTCCIVGGGPAGIMLGFLLARAGVEVVVLEKHADFFRDFRGDTIHPSTLQIMYELGIVDEFLKLPHQEYTQLFLNVNDQKFAGPNFKVLHTHCKFIALMPQWDFLNFIAEHGRKYKTFHLKMEHEVSGLIEEDGKIVGVRGHAPDGDFEVRSDLVVAADGRTSLLRQQSGLEIDDFGAPIDVLWMRLPRTEADASHEGLGYIKGSKLLALINRGDYYQCGLVIPKGGITELKQKGIESVHADLLEVAPFLGDRVKTLKSWDDIKLLNVQMNRMKKWHRSGLLFIGDAAHAMSPAFGVGVNLAVQDAVAASNILQDSLKNKTISEEQLQKVQDRREEPTRKMQDMQKWVHDRLNASFTGKGTVMPWYAKIGVKAGVAQFIMAHVVGLGFRPEHVRQSID